jgi:hypothetical protein
MRSFRRISKAAYFASAANAAPFLLKTKRPTAVLDKEIAEPWDDVCKRLPDAKTAAAIVPDVKSHMAYFGDVDAGGVPFVSSARLHSP